jgi:WD40 repeat protein
MLFEFRRRLPLAICLTLFAGVSVAQEAKPAAPAAPKITYEEHVRPILREHCFSCHSADKQESGLQLDSYQKAMAGGSSGEVVLPGDLASSRLWALVSHAEEPKMPPKQDKLAAAKLETISKWIEQGAPENAGSKVTLKKNPLAAVAASTTGKPEGPLVMPVGLLKQPVHYTSRPGQITALATSPWAPVVAIAGQKQVALYHSDNGQLLGILPFPEGIPQVVRFSRNGSVLLVAGGRGGQSGCVVLFDVKMGKRIAKIGDELDAVLAADINSTHTLVALGGPNRVVRIYSAQTGELLHEIRKHTDWIYATEFSPDGKLLATADRSGGLFVWEGDTAREVLNLRGHTGAVFDVSWRLDSTILASAGEDTTIKLWELNEGKAIKSWNAHTGGAFCVRFTHDGRLVSSGRDNTVKTWGPDGAAQKSFPAFSEPALRCAFTHDGQRVVGGDWLGNVKLWDAKEAKEVLALAANPPTLVMRLDAAKANFTAKQAAAAAADRDLAAVKKAAAEKEQAYQAAVATQKALTAAKTALAQTTGADAIPGVKSETIKAAVESVAAAAAAADAAVEKLNKDKADAQSQLAASQKAKDAAAAAVEHATEELKSADADKKAFDEMGGKLAALAEEATKRLAAQSAEHAQAQAETAATADLATQKAAAAKLLADQLAAIKAELAKAQAEQKSAEETAAFKAKAVADAQAALEQAQATAETAQAQQKTFADAYGRM